MKKIALLFVLISVFIGAQVTLKVTSIPNNTPSGATIYVAGAFNSWNPALTVLSPDGSGNYTCTIPEGSGTSEYKFTRGSWNTVEGNENGQYLPNRSFTFTGSPQTLNLTIRSWEDLGGTSTSTAASNVQILDNNFNMPQLNRTRKIWLYLPPDYATSNKNYPVIYMQDGQNLFDNATSFSGEWQVDETLNNLFQQGDYGAIVVGIDNGGTHRMNEYSPWINPTYGGGEGDEYLQFMVETLKPYIDSHFRTRPEARFTALMGSSLGALISAYGGVKHIGNFGKVGSFSPAYWFVKNELDNYLSTSSANLSSLRIYHVAGQSESSTMTSDIETVKNLMLAKGLTADNSLVKMDAYGQHNENYWKGEFGAAYKWLFQDESALKTTETNVKKNVKIAVDKNKIYISGLDENQATEIIDSNGRVIENLNIKNGWNPMTKTLPKGIYFLKTNQSVSKFLAK